MTTVNPIPQGMGGVTPHLTVRNAASAIAFYRKAFGATEMSRSPAPDGSIMHAAIKVGEGVVFLNDENKEWGVVSPQALGGSPVMLMIYVKDVDATVKQAVSAGAELKMPVSNQFWGDRYGVVADPFGHVWEIASHVEDLSTEEMQRRAREMFAPK